MKDTIKIKGSMLSQVFRNGKLIHEQYNNNIMTSAGKALLASLAGDAAAVPFTYLALGTSSTAVAIGDTTLGAEIVDSALTRSAATVSRVTTTVTNDTLQLVFTWTASGAKTIAEAGIFNAASSGTMLSHLLVSPTVTLANTDTYMVTYKVVFS